MTEIWSKLLNQKIIYPCELLKQFIHYYYVLESNDSFDFAPKQRVYPYGTIICVFHYGNPSLFQKCNEKQETEPRLVICGQQTTYYDLALAGQTKMIFIVFKPFGAGIFFKIPMTEFADHNIALEYIIKKEAFEMEDKILNADNIEARIKIIEDFFIKKLTENNPYVNQIISVFNKINSTKEPISVKQLAETSFLSVKQFERNFSKFVGLMPKQYLRIVRFQTALQLRNHKQFEDYTSLAYQCGYYDQSHFINDFKVITGLTPKEFFESI